MFNDGYIQEFLKFCILRGYSTQTNYFYYRDNIYNFYKDMCTYSQLKKKKYMCNPLPPRGSMAPLMSQNCKRLAE